MSIKKRGNRIANPNADMCWVGNDAEEIGIVAITVEMASKPEFHGTTLKTVSSMKLKS